MLESTSRTESSSFSTEAPPSIDLKQEEQKTTVVKIKQVTGEQIEVSLDNDNLTVLDLKQRVIKMRINCSRPSLSKLEIKRIKSD